MSKGAVAARAECFPLRAFEPRETPLSSTRSNVSVLRCRLGGPATTLTTYSCTKSSASIVALRMYLPTRHRKRNSQKRRPPTLCTCADDSSPRVQTASPDPATAALDRK